MSDIRISLEENGSKGRYVAHLPGRDVEARQNGFTIVPLCPFRKAQADRNPGWADVTEPLKRH